MVNCLVIEKEVLIIFSILVYFHYMSLPLSLPSVVCSLSCAAVGILALVLSA